MADKTCRLWSPLPKDNNEINIQLPHIRLTGKIWGDQDKPLLLALHGWLDNANSFAPLAEYLDDYQLLAIDWSGHGGSDHRAEGYPLHWLDYLFDLDILLNTLSTIKPIVGVIGHSLGAIVAAAYSAVFPDKVAHWIFIEALSPLFESSSKSRKRLKNSFESHRYRLNTGKTPPCYPDIDGVVKARHQLTGLDTKWCKMLIERNMKTVDGGVMWRCDPRLKIDSPMRYNLEYLQGFMDKHPASVLLITGHDGYKVTPAIANTVRSWYQNLTEVELAGDHHLHMGNSVQVASEIVKFLSKP